MEEAFPLLANLEAELVLAGEHNPKMTINDFLNKSRSFPLVQGFFHKHQYDHIELPHRPVWVHWGLPFSLGFAAALFVMKVIL